MSSQKEELSLSNKETTFDTYEIDYRIFNDGKYIQKDSKEKEIINKFELIPNLTKEEIQKKDKDNSEYPKYFCTITTKDFDYIGILSNQLKRDKYGYSKMDNGDEFLGEYKNEIRDGFGIYKYFTEKDEENIQEIYIGNYTNNKKQGEGMYLKISKSIKNELNKNNILINYNSGIGFFEEDIIKYGKIYSSKEGIDMLYQGKLNEKGEPEDDDGLIIEEGNKIFKGKISNVDMVEGRNIVINEKYEKINCYYFRKKENKYDFDYSTKEEIDEDCIKKIKEYPIQNYGKEIQNIFNEINWAFNKFKNYDTAIKVDFENDIKNKIKNEISSMINK